MSSTNKTPNYDLSQYVGTDKPTYLGDYNGDMLKIDAQMKENADAASTAESNAGEAVSKATQAQNSVEALSARVSTVETTVTSQGQTVTQLTNNVNTLVQDNTTNKGNITNLQSELQKNRFTDLTISATSGPNVNASYNEFLKILNIYGRDDISGGTTARRVLFHMDGYSAQSDRLIRNGLFGAISDTGLEGIMIDCTIKKNGDVVFNDASASMPYVLYSWSCNLMLNTSEWGINITQ